MGAAGGAVDHPAEDPTAVAVRGDPDRQQAGLAGEARGLGLDLEAGLGWQSFTGNLRLSMGYLVSGWYNTVQVNDFINSVQTNSFADPADNMQGLFTYDGLTAKVEVLW